MTFVKYLNFALALAAFVTFAWGVKGVFRKVSDRLPFGMSAISICATVCNIVDLYLLAVTERTNPWLVGLGLACLLLANCLFWLAVRENRARPLSLAYSSDLPAHLVQTGPYRFVRHPFYLSYILAYFGCAAATANPLAIAALIAMATIYIHAARTEEAKFRKSSLSDAHSNYLARTGMFLPKPTSFLSGAAKQTPKSRVA